MKLLIIGAGNWARKIESVCIGSDASIGPTVVSSREFLKGEDRFNIHLETYDRIWICTRPQYQLDILSLLTSYPGLIILEKPYVNSANKFHELIYILSEMKNTVVLSQPWTFSNAWNLFKNVSRENVNSDFVITRVGNQAHQYINPVSDWLPHDLNLVLDFILQPLDEVQIVSQEWSKAKKNVQFKMIINESLHFNIESGLSEGERVSIWKNNSLKVDFLNSILTDEFNNQTEIRETHPIVEFLKRCESEISRDVKTSLQFHHQVMRELGL